MIYFVYLITCCSHLPATNRSVSKLFALVSLFNYNHFADSFLACGACLSHELTIYSRLFCVSLARTIHSAGKQTVKITPEPLEIFFLHVQIQLCIFNRLSGSVFVALYVQRRPRTIGLKVLTALVFFSENSNYRVLHAWRQKQGQCPPTSPRLFEACHIGLRGFQDLERSSTGILLVAFPILIFTF